MKPRLIKNLLVSSLFTVSLISINAIAAPKVIFKDIHHKQRVVQATAVPQAIHGVIKSLEAKYPDLHEIVVYKLSDHYVLYLLSGKVWEVTKVRVELDTSGEIKRVIDDVQGVEKELQSAWEEETNPVCPDPSIQFLALSAYPGVAAVDESMAIVSEAAKKKYKTMTIVDEYADGKTYQDWLSCPALKGIYIIGHGSPEGLMVGKGDFVSYKYFSNKKLMNNYQSTTVMINACQVYNYPFGTNIMYGNQLNASEYIKNPGPNAYEYVGGHTNLLMYSSELSSACFMAKAMNGAKMDYDTLKSCIGNQDIHYQNFGMSQPGKYFDKQS
jgi:hypothetical protein